MADSQITFKTLLDNSNLNAGIFESGVAFKGLDQAVNSSNSSIGELVKAQSALLTSLTGTGDKLRQQSATIDSIKTSYSTAKASMEEYKKVLDSSSQKYAESRTGLDQLKQSLNEQKAILQSNSSSLSEARARYNELSDSLGETASETIKSKEAYSTLASVVNDNKTVVEELKSQYSQMATVVKENKVELIGAKDAYASQSDAVNRLGESLESQEEAYRKTSQGLDKIKEALVSTAKEMGSNVWNKFKGSLESIGSTAVRTGQAIVSGLKVGIDVTLQSAKVVMGGIAGLGAIGLKYNADMESYLINFSTLLGGQEEAVAKVEQLKQMASKTPFGMSDLASATETLLGFGVESDRTMGIIKNIGDISLGNADKMSRLTLAFAQVSATGRLMGEEVNQMIEAGFNPLQEISKQTGVSMAELKERMSDGAISADTVALAFQTATAEGGMFYNGMENASKSVSGLVSTIKDDFLDLVGNVFTPVSETLISELLPMIQGYITQMSESLAVDGLQGLISTMGVILADMATYIIEQIPILVDTTVLIIQAMADGLALNAPTLSTALIYGITTAISGILPVLVDLGIVMINALFQGVAEAVPELEGLLLPLQQTFNNLVDVIAESEIIENVIELFKNLGLEAVKLAPAVNNIFDKGLQLIIKSISDAIKLFSDNIETITPFVLALVVAMGAYKASLLIISLINGIGVAIATFKAVTEGATIAQLLLNAAMNANVIIAIISLIIGLVTALIYFWKTNEDFRVAFMGIWATILNFFESVPLFFKKVGYGILDGFSYAKVNVLNVMQAMLNGIIDIVNIGLKALSALTNGAIKPLEYASFATEEAISEAETRANRSKELAGESLALAEKADERMNKLKDSAKTKGKVAGSELSQNITRTATKEIDITSILPPETTKQVGATAGANFGDSLAKGASDKKAKVKKTAAELAKEMYEETVKGINDRKALGELSTEEELKQYKILQNQYKDNAEIKMDIDKTIYSLERELSKKSYDETIKEIETKKYFGKLTLEQELQKYEELAKLYQDDADKKLELDKKVHALKAELQKQQEEALNKLGEATIEALKRQKQQEVDAAKEAIQEQIDAIDSLEYKEITVAENVKETKIKLYDEETRKKIEGIDEGLDKFMASSDKEIQKRIDIIALTDKETANKLQQIKDEETAIKALAESEKTAIREKQELERQRKLEQAVANAEPEKVAEAQKALNDYLDELNQKQKERDRERRLKELEEDKKLTLDSAKAKIEAETQLILDLTKKQTEQIKEVKKGLQVGEPTETGKESLKSLDEKYKEFEKNAEKSALLLIKSGEDGQKKALQIIETFYPEWEDKGKNFVQKMTDGIKSNETILEEALKALPKPEPPSGETGTVEAIVEEITLKTPKLEEPSAGVVTSIIQYMKLQFGKFKEFAGAMFSEIRIHVNNEKWYEIGKDIILGMVNGVVANQQLLIDAVKSAVESAKAVAQTPTVTAVTTGIEQVQPSIGKYALPIPDMDMFLNVSREIPLGIASSGAITTNNDVSSSSVVNNNNYYVTQENTLNGANMTRYEFQDFVKRISREMIDIGV